MTVAAPVLTLVKTCHACPEQYDAYLNGERVGYLRLRHGDFTVEFPDCGSELILSASPEGDGEFLEAERDYFLRLAVDAIQRRLEGGLRPPAPDVKYVIAERP